MKTLIIVHSYHHGNTLKVARAMADVLDAELKTTTQIKPEALKDYDLVGFGAGIDSGMHYKELLDFADNIAANDISKNCFIFSTSAVQGEKKVAKDHSKLREILKTKKYNVLDEFSCKGLNTNIFLKYIGGICKGHPDSTDISNARHFATDVSNMNV